MAIGPVQLIVVGFSHPEFHGEIIAELEKLKESNTGVRISQSRAAHREARRPAQVARTFSDRR